MSDRELALTMQAITQNCDFVNYCTQPANEPNIVIVELALSLALMLPPSQAIMTFGRNDFSEEAVREEFERSIVRPAQELYDLAVALSKRPKNRK